MTTVQTFEQVWTGPVPTLADVMRARQVIREYLPVSPTLRSEPLSQLLGCNVILKCESLNPTGAFKVRGGINYMSHLTPEERERGVVTASTGNHGQSIAWAARLFGTKASIFVPEVHNPLKVELIRNFGAEIHASGKDFDECRYEAEQYANATGALFVHSGNEPHLISGVGTYALELLEFEPEIDAIFAPVGGGSGLCGCLIVAKTMNPSIEVYGTQSSSAPVVHDSWKAHEVLTYDTADTFAEGVATRAAFELPSRIIWEHVDDIVLVSDSDLKRAMCTYLEQTRLVVEGAGAAPLAAAWSRREELQGKTVALIVSGGNVTLDSLKATLNEERAL